MGAAGEQRSLVAQGVWGPASRSNSLLHLLHSPRQHGMENGENFTRAFFVRSFDPLPPFLLIFCLVQFSAGSGVLGCFAS